MYYFVTIGTPLFAQSSEMGAAPLLMAATDAGVKSGEYIGTQTYAPFIQSSMRRPGILTLYLSSKLQLHLALH